MLGMKKWRLNPLLVLFVLATFVVFPALDDFHWMPTTSHFVVTCVCGVIIGLLSSRHSFRAFAARWKKAATVASARKTRKTEFVALCMAPWCLLGAVLGMALYSGDGPEELRDNSYDVRTTEGGGTAGTLTWSPRAAALAERQRLLAWQQRAKLKLFFWASVLAAPFIASFRFRSLLAELDADEATDGT